jgi:Tfp pilus assembly protein FimT
VVALVGILSALAVPQMVAQRRLLRAAGITREIVSQMRYARQLAMSQRQAVTFQYDNVNKQILIIDHNFTGPSVLALGGFPNNAGSAVVSTLPLAAEGLGSSEITYGIPIGLPNGALDDGVSPSNLTVDNTLNITFQPDGSVVDVNGNPQDQALFIFNNRAPQVTAAAISVVGSAGRIKLWRYDINADQFIE